MAVPAIYRGFRTLAPEPGDALDRLGRDGIYDGGRMMAPGGLLLLERMVRRSGIARGGRVLDLGCGRGQSSCRLAADLGCAVTAVDLWTPVADRVPCPPVDGPAGAGVLHYQGDFRRGLPPETEPFDAIVALQSFHAFGAGRAALRYAARLVAPGGRLVLGQTCFSTEPDLRRPPFDDCGGMHADYPTYRTPAWWRTHVEAEGLFRCVHAAECEDGAVMWEDHFLYQGERDGWSPAFLSSFGWLGRQIRAGQGGGPRLSHLLLVAERV